MNMIEHDCPRCGIPLRSRKTSAGSIIRCKNCNAKVNVPIIVKSTLSEQEVSGCLSSIAIFLLSIFFIVCCGFGSIFIYSAPRRTIPQKTVAQHNSGESDKKIVKTTKSLTKNQQSFENINKEGNTYKINKSVSNESEFSSNDLINEKEKQEEENTSLDDSVIVDNFRVWTDNTGKFTVEAEFIDSFNDDTIILYKRNSDKINMPLKRLSSADITWIENYQNSIFKVDNLHPNHKFLAQTIGVVDGDTITVIDLEQYTYKIRLEGIDAPEIQQTFGIESKQSLSNKILNKTVKINWYEKDRYNRILGYVYLGDRYINNEMIKEGLAWHYKEYNNDIILSISESDAKNDKIGLWSESNPISPWDFRHNIRSINHSSSLEFDDKSSESNVIVFVTKSGSKYHRASCSYLQTSSKSLPLDEARKRYSPCSKCKPAH